MRKPITMLIVFFTIVVSIWVQINIINKIQLFGVAANVGLILVCGIGLTSGKVFGATIGGIYGFLIDVIVGKSIGIYILLYFILGMVTGYINNGFSKENKMSFIMIILCATVIFEISSYVICAIIYSYSFDFFGLILVITKEVIYNMIIGAICFRFLANIGELINKTKKSYYLI